MVVVRGSSKTAGIVTSACLAADRGLNAEAYMGIQLLKHKAPAACHNAAWGSQTSSATAPAPHCNQQQL